MKNWILICSTGAKDCWKCVYRFNRHKNGRLFSTGTINSTPFIPVENIFWTFWPVILLPVLIPGMSGSLV